MLWRKNSWGKKFGGLLFLLVSVAVIFGLSSAGCGKKSEKPEPTGQTGYPGTSTGQTGFPTATTFTSPSDAATKIFGSLSAGPANNIITARSFQGEIITARAITARIITGRIITARSPKFFYDDYENNLLSGRLKVSSLSEKQSEGFVLSCEGIKAEECAGGGKVERADCNIDQSKGLLTFQIRLSDCKEIIDQSKGDYIVSTGYAKGYVEVSTKVSSNGFESSIIFAVEDGDLSVREFRGNKETKRVRTKYSGYKNEFIYGFISGDKDVEMKVASKLSGSYSREDEIGKRKEAYSYYDFASVLTGKFPSSGEYQLDITSFANYLSISGGYSVDTEPSSCVEGVFYYKTIKPIKFGLFEGEGFCGAESGEIEVNNAKMTFSPGRVIIAVTVGKEYQGGTTGAVEQAEAVQYSCGELATLCEYEPITIAEGIEQKPCPVWFKDADKDGYTDGTTEVSCEKPSDEYVSSATGGDCNDNDPNINPAKAEICDGKDNNCNGQPDEGCGVAGAKVAVREFYTCAIKMDGSLWCWGDNDYGQVGDGTNTNKNTPVRVMSSGVAHVALGDDHTCAIKTDGSLWCWGYNGYGQLGDGTNSSKNIPVQIMSSGVSSVASGVWHTCAIKRDGSLWCWGWNQYGQLGDGTNIDKNTPIQIMPSGVVAVASGDNHTCAIKQDSSLWCWGWNDYGQIGNGTYTGRNTPVQVISSGVSYVALGDYHTCAVKTDGSLWCWGRNDYGQLGDGTWTNKNTPVRIMSSGVSSVALGHDHTCAIKTDGSLWCWGRNDYGQLGDGTYTNKNTPTYIMNLGSGGGSEPIGVWRLDEGSGSTAYDTSGNSRNGVIYGATWINGKYGKALTFDGIDDYVDLSDYESALLAPPFTIAFWVNPSEFGRDILGSEVNYKGFGIFTDYSGQIYLASSNEVINKWGTGEYIPQGSYTFITLIYTANSQKLYINGNLRKSYSYPYVQGSGKLAFGRASWGAFHQSYFKGIIDEVYIFNRELTPEEISNLYSNQSYAPPIYRRGGKLSFINEKQFKYWFSNANIVYRPLFAFPLW